MSSKYHSSLHFCLQVKFSTWSRWAACNSSPVPSEVKGEDSLTSKAAKEEEGKVEATGQPLAGRLRRLFAVVNLIKLIIWLIYSMKADRVQQSVSLLLVFAQPSLFGCNWTCQLWGWPPLFEMVREGDRPQSFATSMLRACDKVKLEGKAKEELKVRGVLWGTVVQMIHIIWTSWHHKLSCISLHHHQTQIAGWGFVRKRSSKKTRTPGEDSRLPQDLAPKLRERKTWADWQRVKGCVRWCRPDLYRCFPAEGQM